MSKDRKYDRTPGGRYRRLTNRAKTKNIECTLTLEDYAELVEDPCIYCDGPLPETGFGIDRKDSDKGYTLVNSVPCCWDCNNIKGTSLTHQEAMVAIRAIKAMRVTKP